MKVVLSESQVLNILNEITSEQRMDFLLDKVSEGGIESLTPAEKIELRRLSGEDVGSDEEEYSTDDEPEYNEENMDVPDVIKYIYNNFPDGITYNIGASWEAFASTDDNEFKISITDGDRLIDVFPFKGGDSILRVLSTERSPFKVNLGRIPNNVDEAENFVRSLLNVELPRIITYVLKTS